MSLSFSTFTLSQSILESETTNNGIIFPKITTIQRNLLSPTQGQCICNITLNLLECYTGVFWTTAGPVGATGATGPQGETGATGPVGPQGEAGWSYWSPR